MDFAFWQDDESVKLYRKAKDLTAKGDFIKALKIHEDLLLVHSEDDKRSLLLHFDQGQILIGLAEKAMKTDMEVLYLIGAVGCLSNNVKSSGPCARILQMLGKGLGSVLYYKQCVKIGKQALSVPLPDASDSGVQNFLRSDKKELESLIRDAETKISISKTICIKIDKPEVCESKKNPEPVKNEVQGLRSFWLGLDVKIKRDFMKVNIAKFLNFVEGVHKRKGRDVLEEVLTSARKDRKWRFWICRSICMKEFSSAEECKTHFEQHHAADFIPSSEKYMVKRIGKDWARKIRIGGWEPVDTVAAVEMIKNRLADVKAFAYKNGWSKEWPLATDEKRSKLLKDIKFQLMLFSDEKVLSCSIRDWVMRFPVKHLEKLEVSEQSLVDIHLLETTQSICFLESDELKQILHILNRINCERPDGTDVVYRAVDNILSRTRVKVKIDFDPDFSYLLLDRRLLKSFIASFDEEGTINVFDPSVHYAKSPAQGDDIISWLVDYSSVDKNFLRPIREHNLDIWLAVLRAVQFTCRTLAIKYAKKAQVLDYDEALTSVENLCISENEQRMNLPEDQWNRYASLLCNRCEEIAPENSSTTKLFLCAVRDILEGALFPRFDFPNLRDLLNLTRERKILSDDIVMKSIGILKSEVTHKVLLIDSKILLIDNSRISLLNNLTRLSLFDNRSYILQVLKPFLLSEIMNRESKAKSDAAEAAEASLLLEEEKSSQSKKKNPKNKRFSTSMSSPLDKTIELEPSVNLEPESTSPLLKMVEDAAEDNIPLKGKRMSQSKKNKNKTNKRTSTSMSSPLDKTVELEPSVNLEQEGTSPSLKLVEEDSMEPEDILSSKSRVEISSSKVTRGLKSTPGEDSLSEHLESALVEAAARYNSALDMTLKAVLNIKVFKEDLMHNKEPFHHGLEGQVISALQNLFSAFLSEEIKNEEVYSYLLSDLLASLEVVHSMSSGAAEVLVAILEFWHYWKNSEGESLVTRLFTLEENESMSCRKCRRKANYLEQTSYGIVIAADSISELKCAFGNIKFVDILKVIRMEDEMLCDIETGGCGKTNIVCHTTSKCPPIFIIMLKWEKSETQEEISEITNALEWEIDISRLYEGLEPKTNYRLVSMVGCDEEEKEHICIAYQKRRWVNLSRESFEGKVVGNWKNVGRFCGERKVRPQILFYESA